MPHPSPWWKRSALLITGLLKTSQPKTELPAGATSDADSEVLAHLIDRQPTAGQAPSMRRFELATGGRDLGLVVASAAKPRKMM